MAEQSEAVCVDRLRTDPGVKARHGFGVVVEDVRPSFDNGAHRVEVALEVWRQDLDRGAGALPPDRADGPRKNSGASVLEIVAVHRCDHRVLQPELPHRFRDPQRLAEVKLRGPARRYGAKTACSRADITQDHEGRRAPVPAIEDVGATCLFAHCVQTTPLHDLFEFFEVAAFGDPDADPFRDRRRLKRLRWAHSRMLPAVHSSSRFLIAPRN